MRHPRLPYPREDDAPALPAWTALLSGQPSPIDEATTEVPVITPTSGRVADTSAEVQSAEVAVETEQVRPDTAGRDGVVTQVPEIGDPRAGAVDGIAGIARPGMAPTMVEATSPVVEALMAGTPEVDAPAPQTAAADEDEPGGAVYPPAGTPMVPALRPGDVSERPIAIWPGDQAQRIRDRWRDLQVLFIDEPDEAVAGARSLVTDAVRTLSDRLLAEQDEFDPRRDNERPDTEALRVAMRRYREFLDRVLAL